MSKKNKAPARKAEEKKEQPQSLRAMLDLVGVLVGAVCIALVVKAYVFDVYLIPSGSMETSLHGRPDGGDRIFCSKLHYRFRDLKRWEVAVFEFPYESARRSDPFGNSEQYRETNFVKRVVGLPGENLAIAKGDIWVKPDDAQGYHREVKPDSVQRGMWLNVYEEDFSDLRDIEELRRFWNFSGDGAVALGKGEPLVLSPGQGNIKLAYRPRVPAGEKRDALPDLPGIPDRYTLDQPVQFQCRNILENGEVCGHIYVKSFKTHNIQARCPVCGSLQPETSAIFYQRRSGLTRVGPYAVNPEFAPQGEQVAPRQVDYHFVPDLRSVNDVVFAAETSRLGVTLSEDSRKVEAVFFGDGRIEIKINGQDSRPENRAVAEMRPGKRHRLEFYIVDGAARIFVDSESRPLLEAEVWKDKRPTPRATPRSSGLTLEASGGEITLRRILIDRDVFYYSGWEKPGGEQFGHIGAQGESYINAESFFPMGDHCPSSYDARSWGPVPLSNLRGPALLIWWPPERISVIPSP